MQTRSSSPIWWLDSRIATPSPASSRTSAATARAPAGPGRSSARRAAAAAAAQQRGGDPEPLAHPGRVAAHAIIGPLGETDALERASRSGPRPDACRRRAAPAACRFARAAQVRVEARVLDEAADAVQGGRSRVGRARRPSSSIRPGIGSDQPEQHPQQRRLAGAVGPEQPAHLAGSTARSTPSTATVASNRLTTPLARTACHSAHYMARRRRSASTMCEIGGHRVSPFRTCPAGHVR